MSQTHSNTSYDAIVMAVATRAVKQRRRLLSGCGDGARYAQARDNRGNVV